MLSNYFYPKSLALYEIMWENMVEPVRPQVTMQQGLCALHTGKQRQEYSHTLIIFDTYCFFRAEIFENVLRYTYITCFEFHVAAQN